MASKLNQIEGNSSWYNSLYNAIKQAPINIPLLIVSAFVFFRLVRITRHRRNRFPQRERQMPPRTNGFEDISYLPFRRDFTVSELLEFDGTGRDGRILLAINFHVYDVSEARNSYGLDGMYANYAGRDISRNLINFSIETHGQDDFDDLSDLSLAQMNTLLEWDEQYKEKYPYVGRLIRNNEPHTNYADEEDDETEPETVENIQST